MPVIVRFQSTGTIPGDGRPVPMMGASLTIGRGDENDVVLPDPDKTVSKRHCAIEDQNGNVVVIDLSTNGTFLNYGKVPLGQVPTPLNDGDVLCIGSYELVIDIPVDAPQAGADLPPLDDAPVSHGHASVAAGLGGLDDSSGGDDFLDDLLGPSTPAGHGSVARPGLDDAGPGADGLLPPLDDDDLLGPGPASSGPAVPQHTPSTEDAFRPPTPQANQIPDDWDDLLEPPGQAQSRDNPFLTPPPSMMPSMPAPGAPPPEPGSPEPEPEVTRRPDPAPEASPPPAPTRPAPVGAGGTGAATQAFLDGADLGEMTIDPAELPAVMGRLGRVFRTMVEGLRDVLMHRTALKTEFRIETTMISAAGNNPLKFSISADQAMEALVAPKRGYQDPEIAAREALDDVKAHEVAMVTGMEAALKGVLHQLAPEQLEGKITSSGGIGGMFKGRKARYWEAYEELYGEIAEQAETDFQELFAKEFARAYQEQMTRLKTQKRSGG